VRWTVVAALVIATFIGVLGPVLVAAWTGSLPIPHNDAWAFTKAAQTFAHARHIQLLNWNSMSLVGLFAPLGPLGASIKAQQCYVAALGLIGLLAGYDVLRRDVGSRRAAVGVLVLVSWPGSGALHVGDDRHPRLRRAHRVAMAARVAYAVRLPDRGEDVPVVARETDECTIPELLLDRT
jgi:hypothetical protein